MKKFLKAILDLICMPFLLLVFVVGFPLYACLILKDHIDEWL
jgi:hypothetical protein